MSIIIKMLCTYTFGNVSGSIKYYIMYYFSHQAISAHILLILPITTIIDLCFILFN